MKHLIWTGLFLISFTGISQNFNAGIRIQKTNGMYWENGISFQYSFKNLKTDQLYFGFDYVTTRWGSAMGSNALKQDNYLFSSSWAFRKEKSFRPIVRLNIGYLNVDFEEEIFESLPHSAFLLSPEFLVSYAFKNIPVSIHLGSGYYIDFAEEGHSPGTFQPLYYHLNIYYTLLKTKTNE